ncbi:MAG: proton-conducting transporter membrane subunit, partial [Gammaproteobacteria bacterium]
MFFALTTAQIAVFSALAAAVLALFPKRLVTIAKFSSCFFLFLSGLIAVYAGALALIGGKIFSWYFNPGFFGIIWHFKIDALAGFFLGITGLITACVAIYAPGYLRNCERKRSLTDILFFTALFVAGMYLVILANDAYSFMLAWELMSISSYFLVAYKHDESANSSAAFIYLLMAHASGLFILLGYSVLIKFSHEYTFAALANAHLAPTYATAAFLLALTGFSIKAGIMPLHVWLPRAHPVAPSHVSALMSGVMLKVAIYGLLRFTFSLLGNPTWQCGVIVLFLGTLATVLGVLYALMQHDLKKLLAYHSIENIGIIFIGIGLAMIFYATNHPIIAALGLIAALYHSLNHAIFKSLLFLGAGAIVEQSHEHDLEKMGGLIHKMPYTALFFLVGCISISVLPPFNGFVSEWLTFQTALQAPLLSSGILRTLIPVAAALLALAGALTAACFVKVYGVAFLGKARTKHVKHAKDPVFGMCFAMGILSLLCLVFGL